MIIIQISSYSTEIPVYSFYKDTEYVVTLGSPSSSGAVI